jgi:hypothetical protein
MEEHVAQAGSPSSYGRVRGTAGEEAIARGENAVLVLAVVDRQSDLAQVVARLHAGGGLADFLDGGQEQADEHRDDGDDD